jgi:acetolactate synthase-1/2/3 large subunit
VSSPAAELADSIVGGLAAAGTRVVYGLPGGGNNLEVVGACERAGLRFVLVHGESAAVIMAGVDGELTGAPGACVVTRGPGVASAVNGAAQALLDRQPLLLISDAVPFAERTRVSHQRLDQDALLAPVTKWSTSIGLDGAQETVAAAIRIACAAPQGPVHLAFTPDAPRPALPPPGAAPPRGDIAAAARLLAASRRPVFALGVGARRARVPLRRLLAGTPWPVLTTYKAKGLLSEHAGNAAGLLTGATIEAPILAAADLIVAVGLDPVELIPAPWPYRAPVLALGEWPLADPFFEPATELVGPLAELLALVSEHLPAGGERASGRAQRVLADDALRVPTAGLAPHVVVEAARSRAPAGAVATVDAGAHMLVAMPLWEVAEPGEALISSGLATMGFALPAAIAAAIARPDRHVVCFVGDGGLGMALAELETVSRLGLPVTVVVFDDAALSLIEIKQAADGHGGQGAVRYREADFAGIARAMGIPARRVEDERDLLAALDDAFGRRGPYLVDAVVDPSGYAAVLAAIRGGRAIEPNESAARIG